MLRHVSTVETATLISNVLDEMSLHVLAYLGVLLHNMAKREIEQPRIGMKHRHGL